MECHKSPLFPKLFFGVAFSICPSDAESAYDLYLDKYLERKTSISLKSGITKNFSYWYAQFSSLRREQTTCLLHDHLSDYLPVEAGFSKTNLVENMQDQPDGLSLLAQQPSEVVCKNDISSQLDVLFESGVHRLGLWKKQGIFYGFSPFRNTDSTDIAYAHVVNAKTDKASSSSHLAYKQNVQSAYFSSNHSASYVNRGSLSKNQPDFVISGKHDGFDANTSDSTLIQTSGGLQVNTLSGQGTFYGGMVTVNNSLEINNATSGLDTFYDGLTLTETTRTHFDLGGYLRGGAGWLEGKYDFGYDAIDIAGGTLILDGVIVVRQTSWFHTMNLKAGDSFKLFDFSAADQVIDNGFVFDFSLAPLAPGLVWDTGSFLEDGTIVVSNIPEPSSALLFVAATSLLLLRRRRAGLN